MHWTEFPKLEPLRKLIGRMHSHLVVICQQQIFEVDLVQFASKLGRSCDFESFDLVESLQQIVYNIQKDIDFFPLFTERAALEQIAKWTYNSPVLVDITSNILRKRFEEASISSSCHLAQQRAMREGLLSFKDALTQSLDCTVDGIKAASLSKGLIDHTRLSREARHVLNCLVVFFEYMPIPASVAIELSHLTAKASDVGISYGSLLTDLMKAGYVKVYPSPIVHHPSTQPSPRLSCEPELVCVPLAHSLWETMAAYDRVAALGSCHESLCSVTLESSNVRFILGLISVLLKRIEHSKSNMGHRRAAACYSKVHELYIRLTCLAE